MCILNHISMKKVNLKHLESYRLSSNEKQRVAGGVKKPILDIDTGARCRCRDGSWVMPISFKPFLCPSDCPIAGIPPMQ